MRLAVIDLGTNTFNLLIGETGKEFTFKKIFNTKISVKLGEGSIMMAILLTFLFKEA